MSDAREREFALREAAVNDVEERYFKARPIDDGAMQRKAFRAGFDRAWDAKERELADARAERNAAIARSMSNAMEAQAHEDRARMAEAECERLREDAERLDWMDRNAFTAYRDVDPEYGTLDDHATVVAEGRRERRGCVGTIRAAIDAARNP